MKHFPCVSRIDSIDLMPLLEYCLCKESPPKASQFPIKMFFMSVIYNIWNKIQIEYTGKGIEMSIFIFVFTLAAYFNTGSSLSTRF